MSDIFGVKAISYQDETAPKYEIVILIILQGSFFIYQERYDIFV